MEKVPYLLLHTAKGSNRYLPLVGGNYWTIGRSKGNNFVIPDQWISRNHAMLQTTSNGDFYLIDLGSRNGTFVNGRRVSIPVILRDSDDLTLGKTKLEFHSPIAESRKNKPITGIDADTPTNTLHVRRLMSVVVIDIRSYTLLARQLDDNILSALIGTWFRQAGNIIRDSGSWVDKYIGDAVMAIWFHGQKEVTKEKLTKIFQAVMALNKMTVDLNNQYTLPFELRIGAGINTGYAMVGNTGTGDHPDYTAIGDTVNLAFRLESATKEVGLDVVLGESTYNYLSQLPEVQQRFEEYTIKLKGYDMPKTIYGSKFQDLDNFFLDNSHNNPLVIS
ncbi:MAG: adenylate/guanylate cyclase domain-containing protein [Prochloraceae cyanobacterium]|nr:adenylate/guanylate cyclase domain-containing protein [Prochloraceae cyanobacterium]